MSLSFFPSRVRRARQMLPQLMILISALVLMTVTSRADEVTSRFDAANKLYEESQFTNAAAIYSQMIAAGTGSAAVYFNEGNAWFKAGQVGRAIVCYRDAERLAPRDSAVRANLQFARTAARGGATYNGSRIENALNRLSVNEWTALTVVAAWLFFAFLAWGELRVDLKAKLRGKLLTSAVFAVLFGICLAINLNREYLSPAAIVIAGEAEVRNGPLDESPSVFRVRDGVELTVIDQKDGWLQITDSTDRVGWIRQDQVIAPSVAQNPKS